MAFQPQNFIDQVGPDVSAEFLNGLDLTCNQGLNGLTTQAAIAAWLGVPTGGTPLSIAIGGTGANNATQALTNLGGTTLAAAVAASSIPITTSEIVMGMTIVNSLYPPGNVLRYGIVPNTGAVADNNTTVMNKLVSYSLNNAGWTGTIVFPNTTGADTYFFDNYLDFRPGIEVDLQWCTLSFNKTADSTDPNSGFISAIRDFSIKNGYIVVTSTCTNGMNAMMFGARGADGTYFVPMYDAAYLALTGSTMGNIKVQNVKVSSANAGNRCVLMFGGLQNVIFENFWVDGAGVCDGIYYEYGWATDAGGVLANRQTSHAHNLSFKNIRATNIAGLGALVCNGAYNVSVDGLDVIISPVVCAFGPGEAWYYRPWASVDDGGVTKCTVSLKNIIGKGITGVGISITGANNASTLASGYLQATINALSTPSRWIVLSDRISARIDGFYMNGSSSNYGISVQGAEQIDIANGRVVGFQRGISTTSETIRYSVKNVTILDSTVNGLVIGSAFPVWSPARFSMGEIVGCSIKGSTGAAIVVATAQGCSIRKNTFGYLITQDGVAESTQLQAVSANGDASGVVCDQNWVAAVSSGNAYNLAAAGSSSRGCTVTNNFGVSTFTGIWENTLNDISSDNGDASITYQAHRDALVQLFATTLTANRTVTLSTTNANTGDKLRVVRTGLGSFTLAVGSIKTIPSGTAAFVEIEFDGTAWNLIGYGAL